MNFLVVCSGNICRSPMAEIYLKSRLAVNGQTSGHRAASAGTLGIIDDPAAAAAIEVMDGNGLDLRAHRSRGLNREEVEDADFILVMEEKHRRHMGTFYPAHVDKVRLLSEYAPKGSGITRGGDIFDPVGMERQAFHICFRMIQACVDTFVEHLDE